MLINSDNECSTLAEQGSVGHTEDLAHRLSATLQSSPVSDRSSTSLQGLDPEREDCRGAPLAQQRSFLARSENASELQALRQAACLGEQQKQRGGSIRKEAIVSFDIAQPVGNFAAPLSPLRERDLNALSKLFLTDTMSAIEADIAQLLIRLQPEPCWEDDPFAFLQDFL